MTIFERIQLEKFLKKERAWACFRKNLKYNWLVHKEQGEEYPASLKRFRKYVETYHIHILKMCKTGWKVPRNAREKYSTFTAGYWYNLNIKFLDYLNKLL